ncbi:hypothetical protein [Olleya sp. YS]|uniref:hypothetical protein n=1 Tax=Olleya sp. YS TaxID=3028318 RepID=UPI0024343725|nr:hypothetical protein [Olleya sp. YS]WGD33807.1 hypothetical protein Ollyesu_08440 [Olleya sp. YS]
MNNTNKLHILIIGILVLTQSCKSLKNATNESKTAEITLYQNGNEKIIPKGTSSIAINKDQFSLRFYNKKYNSVTEKYYATQIGAFIDPNDLEKIKVGMKTQDLPCFELGSGMAPDTSGKYESLIFNNSGHHYLNYENSDSKRLNLLKTEKEYRKLEFEINRLYLNNKDVSMRETELSTFYLAILIDENLNGIIEKGELTKLTVDIK